MPASERVYAIRITGPAAADVEEAAASLSSLVGDGPTDDWEDGFYEAIRTLSRMPSKHPLAERESRHFGLPVRVLLYKRHPAGAAYRVLFTVVEGASDPPFVRLLHIRHGARRPITQVEAQERLRAVEDAD